MYINIEICGGIWIILARKFPFPDGCGRRADGTGRNDPSHPGRMLQRGYTIGSQSIWEQHSFIKPWYVIVCNGRRSTIKYGSPLHMEHENFIFPVPSCHLDLCPGCLAKLSFQTSTNHQETSAEKMEKDCS